MKPCLPQIYLHRFFYMIFYMIISSGERRRSLSIDYSSQFEGFGDKGVSHAFRVTCQINGSFLSGTWVL